MDVVDDAVARGDHADGVADDGGGRIGGRRDGGDGPERRRLGQRQSVIAGDDVGIELLDARRLLGDQAVLDHLVLVPSVPRLVMRRLGQHLGVVQHRLADGGDDARAVLELERGELRLRGARGGHRLVDGLEHAEAGLNRRGGRGGDELRHGQRAAADVGGDAPRDLVDVPVCQACRHERLTSCISPRRRPTSCRRWPGSRSRWGVCR